MLTDLTGHGQAKPTMEVRDSLQLSPALIAAKRGTTSENDSEFWEVELFIADGSRLSLPLTLAWDRGLLHFSLVTQSS